MKLKLLLCQLHISKCEEIAMSNQKTSTTEFIPENIKAKASLCCFGMILQSPTNLETWSHHFLLMRK